jgi:hypothetical protein
MTTNPQTAPALTSATPGPLFQIWLQPEPAPRCIPLLARGEPYDVCDALMCRIITEYEAGRSEWESIFAVWTMAWGEQPVGEVMDCHGS